MNFLTFKELASGDGALLPEIVEAANVFRKVFSTLRFIEGAFAKHLRGGEPFSMPPVYQYDKKSICVGSYFDIHNFLLFRGDITNKLFYAIQANKDCGGLVFLDEEVFLATDSVLFNVSGEKVKPRLVSGLVDYASGKSVVDDVRLIGLIDGMNRPYHYFYDRLPFIVHMTELFPEIPVFSLSVSFAPSAERLGVRRADQAILNVLTEENDGFLFQPFRALREGHDYLSSILIEFFLDDIEKVNVSDADGDVVIWLGVCQEKRAWAEKVDILVDLIGSAARIFDSPTIVLDGMTCSEFEVVSEFRSNRCVAELQIRDLLVQKFPSIRFVDLIGEKSIKKIAYAIKSDFFFSSALTDSVWPAHFGYTPGIAYSSRLANVSDQHHPLTYLAPEEFVYDIGSSKVWHRQACGVDAGFLQKALYNGLIFIKDLKERSLVFRNQNVGAALCPRLVDKSPLPWTRYKVDFSDSVNLQVYSCSSHTEHGGFSVLSNQYTFCVSFRTEGEVKAKFFLVILSSSGSEVERVFLNNGAALDYELPLGASGYRLEVNVSGFGDLIFHGFYAQAV